MPTPWIFQPISLNLIQRLLGPLKKWRNLCESEGIPFYDYLPFCVGVPSLFRVRAYPKKIRKASEQKAASICAARTAAGWRARADSCRTSLILDMSYTQSSKTHGVVAWSGEQVRYPSQVPRRPAARVMIRTSTLTTETPNSASNFLRISLSIPEPIS